MNYRPKILLATSCRWFSAARLAISFARTGCIVEAVCPNNHPLEVTSVLSKRYRFDALAPGASLKEAMKESRPDLVIACDDLAAIQLRRIYGTAAASSSPVNTELIELLGRSLGEPSTYPILESRARFLKVATEEGIRTPETTGVNSKDEVRQWCKTHGFPAVLKADGTSGGQGVKVVHNIAQALKAFRALGTPPPMLVVAKRAIVDRDMNLVIPWLRRLTHPVSIQPFVKGTDFNITLACWKGEVIASIGAKVLATWETNGPASVIHVVLGGEMLRMAEKLAKRLQLSGLCGLDFLVEEKTGEYVLLEINPRATQTGHLPLGPGHDLPSALYSALSGKPHEAVSVTAREEIALFPLAWRATRPLVHLATAYEDIPNEEPQLVTAGHAETHLLSHAKWVQVWKRALPGRGLKAI